MGGAAGNSSRVRSILQTTARGRSQLFDKLLAGWLSKTARRPITAHPRNARSAFYTDRRSARRNHCVLPVSEKRLRTVRRRVEGGRLTPTCCPQCLTNTAWERAAGYGVEGGRLFPRVPQNRL